VTDHIRYRRLRRPLGALALVAVGAVTLVTTIPALSLGDAGSGVALAYSAARIDEQRLTVEAEADVSAPHGQYTVDFAPVVAATADLAGSLSGSTKDVGWPLEDGGSSLISGYGARASACAACSTMHLGADFGAAAGTPIHSVADGVVTLVSEGGTGWGTYVTVAHDVDGVQVTSLSAHMTAGSPVVEAGDRVERGDVLGLVGMTGTATVTHVHLEIHIDGGTVDPYAWLQSHVKEK
jgi:murein DD-endopeptidase MepM/ murein hydrolase activator NlpD